MNTEHYFLGGSAPNGFQNAVDDIINDTENCTFILKGTAGSGKSTLMKKISAAFQDCDPVLFHCSSDPESLDGVYIKQKKVFILDGTSPHCFDPKYPKAVETIIDLGEYISGNRLREEREKIISLTDRYSVYHKRCRCCLSAISSVLTDIMSGAGGFINVPKLQGFTERTIHRLIPKRTSSSDGRILFRQLSAATMSGYATYVPDSFKLYVLMDDTCAAASYFLKKAADAAISGGYDVYVSRCLISSEGFYEHIIIPELSLAFITSTFWNCVQTDNPKKLIRFKRFYTTSHDNEYSRYKSRLSFGKKAVRSLIEEISHELTSAKALHDSIEEYYVKAADFDGINRLSLKLISLIKGL